MEWIKLCFCQIGTNKHYVRPCSGDVNTSTSGPAHDKWYGKRKPIDLS